MYFRVFSVKLRINLVVRVSLLPAPRSLQGGGGGGGEKEDGALKRGWINAALRLTPVFILFTYISKCWRIIFRTKICKRGLKQALLWTGSSVRKLARYYDLLIYEYQIPQDFVSIKLIKIYQIISHARNWFKCVTWLNIPQLKLEDIRVTFTIIQNCPCCIWSIISAVASLKYAPWTLFVPQSLQFVTVCF